MQAKIIIFLSTTQQPSWVVCDEHGETHYQIDDTSQLIALAVEKEIILIVPAEDCLLLLAKLPKMSRSKLEHALPFSLEEQLIADVDKLHFAHADYLPDGTLPVIVVAKEKMQQWLATLRTWNIVADKMYAASMLIPTAENRWQITITENVLLRISQQVMSCEQDNLREVLEIALATASQLPDGIDIHNYTKNKVAQDLITPVAMTEHVYPAQQYFTDMARLAQHSDAINLLQAGYLPKKTKLPQTKRLWKYLSYTAATWVGLLFLYPIISYVILAHKANALSTEIAAIYSSHFPNASEVIAPKQRMQEKLQKINADIGQSKYLLSLTYLGKGLEHAKGVSFKRIDYQNSQLTVELLATSSDEFSQFTDYLTQQGLTIKQQNAKLNGAHISATLIVE